MSELRSESAGGLQALAARVAVLERENRWIKRLGLAGGAIAGALLVMGQGQAPPPDAPKPEGRVVEAERFVVRDATGKERAVLGLDHPSAPTHSPVRIGLYNEGSTAIMYLSDGFAGLSVTSTGGGHEGKRSVQLFANPKEGGGLKVAAGNRKAAATLSVDRAGEATLALEKSAGGVAFKAP
jgi:hypothetical protein